MDGNANYDIGLRSVASFVTAILSLSLLFFLIHRLRQRKIQGKIRQLRRAECFESIRENYIFYYILL